VLCHPHFRGALLTLLCGCLLVGARGAARDWAVTAVSLAHTSALLWILTCWRGAGGALGRVHAVTMAGVATAAIVADAIASGAPWPPWDAQVRVVGVRRAQLTRAAQLLAVCALVYYPAAFDLSGYSRAAVVPIVAAAAVGVAARRAGGGGGGGGVSRDVMLLLGALVAAAVSTRRALARVVAVQVRAARWRTGWERAGLGVNHSCPARAGGGVCGGVNP
jgi:hypothetical protein